jgi:antagonist of KipI
MDRMALRTANLLVGNDEGEAALEMTMVGATLSFEGDTLLAVCGGEMELYVEGLDGFGTDESHGKGLEPVLQAWRWQATSAERVPMNRPVLVRGGSVLRCGWMRAGCRAYLAVAGGFALEPVLGSRSTDLRASIGGFAGRALQAGDALAQRPLSALAARIAAAIFAARGVQPGGDWAGRRALAAPFAAAPAAHTALPARPTIPAGHTAPLAIPAPYAAPAPADAAPPAEPTPIRILRGERFADFDLPSQAVLFAEPYAVSPQADRMGCRLDGPPLRLAVPRELLSAAVAPGAIQVPPDGRPIVLMADCQTTGGYPIIGHVISADMPLMAQLPIGSRLYFHEVTMEEAHQMYVEGERSLKLLSRAIRLKIGE